MTFDPTKPAICRNGRPARVICTDRKGPGGPIVALVSNPEGHEVAKGFMADGTCVFDPSDFDLINVHEKVTRWVYWNRKSETFDLLAIPPNKETLGPLDTYYPIEIEVGRKE